MSLIFSSLLGIIFLNEYWIVLFIKQKQLFQFLYKYKMYVNHLSNKNKIIETIL